MPFGSLWLPVVVAAVAVFLMSSIIHMVLKYHKADYKKLADEDSTIPTVQGSTLSFSGVYQEGGDFFSVLLGGEIWRPVDRSCAPYVTSDMMKRIGIEVPIERSDPKGGVG